MICFFRAFAPAYAIEKLFWSCRGMTIPLMIACEMLYGILTLMLEIPSGIWADRLGRKRLLLIDGIIAFIEFACLLFAHHPVVFFLIIILSSLGNACQSGSTNALIYDSLAVLGKKEAFEKVIGRGQTLYWLSIAGSSILGGILAEVLSFESCYFIASISMGLSFLLTLCFVEAPTSQLVSKQPPHFKAFTVPLDYLKSSISFFRGRPQMLCSILVYTFLGASIIYLEEFWQFLLESYKMPYFYFGIFLSLYGLLRIPGETFAYLFKAQLTKLIKWAPLVYALAYMGMHLYQGMISFFIMLLLSFFSGLLEPLMLGYLHHHADGQIRATLESVLSFMQRSFSLITGLVFGLATRKQLTHGYICLALLCLVVYLLQNYFFHLNKSQLE